MILAQLSDILLIGGAIGAAFYCIVLARRLNRFNDLEKGVGGAIAVLSAQVDDMTRALRQTREAAGASSRNLEELTARADEVARRLELLVASLHDLPSVSRPVDGSGSGETGGDPPADATPRRPSPDGDGAEQAAPALFRSHRRSEREAAE